MPSRSRRTTMGGRLHSHRRGLATTFAVAALALGTLAAAPAAADEAADHAAILKAEQDWLAATEAGHRAALERLLHPTFVNISPLGGMRNRAESLSAGPPPPGSSQTLTELKVRTFRDSAVVTGVNRYRPNAKSKPTDVVFTDVFVRTPHGWQVVSSHNSIRPAAAER
ncbi:nuclear transport factor 2 family protein [Cupriavidus gilardii]|nr:nuclear transport factor 2 family protein [Cupriavidus gilardii]